MLIYFKSKKYNEINKYEYFKKEDDTHELKFNSNNNSKKYLFNKNINNNIIKNNIEYSNIKSSEELSKLEDNILGNVHLSSDEEDNITNIISMNQNKNHYNSIRRISNNNDINDIELLLDKLITSIVQKEYRRHSKKRETLKDPKIFIFNKEVKAHNSINNENNKNVNNKISEKNENSFKFDNASKTFYRKISKKKIFQTSLRGRDGIFNKNKKNILTNELNSQQYRNKTNEIKKNTNNYINSKFNNSNRLFKSNISFIPFSSDKNNKKQLKNNIKKSNSGFFESNILDSNKLKNNITSIKSQKDIRKKI